MIVYIQTSSVGKYKVVNSDDVSEIVEYQGEGVCDLCLSNGNKIHATDLEAYLVELGWRVAGFSIQDET